MRYLVLFIGLIGVTLSSIAQKKYFQQGVKYQIQVELNDKQHALNAFMVLQYTNNSPDTLTEIWFHIWPNAYKNDKTAFSEQLLLNGRTDFYFAPDSTRGYMNKLNFAVNNVQAEFNYHPQYLDVLQLKLPKPLLPKDSINITTPFYVQMPYNFSRGGHIYQSYQVTQWYPKPAVYDVEGWHAMPYLDQGEFYSEIGTYQVAITVPENYIVAASGTLQTESEKNYLQSIANQIPEKQAPNQLFQKQYNFALKNHKKIPEFFEKWAPASAKKLKTIEYTITNAHDFAWFASKQFLVQRQNQTIGNQNIQLQAFYFPWDLDRWASSLKWADRALQFYTEQIGDYPYITATIVSGNQNVSSGGMEYPSIALITTQGTTQELDATIAHELGHNWFYGALANNERKYAWLDEGFNSFYEQKYLSKYYPVSAIKKSFWERKLPDNFELNLIEALQKTKKSQPINTLSHQLTSLNYGLTQYVQAAEWLKALETKFGEKAFKDAMQRYYQLWQFKHPQPTDLQHQFEEVLNTNLQSEFNNLNLPFVSNDTATIVKKLKPTWIFSFKNTKQYNYLQFLPVIGYNTYDKLMPGILVHNYNLPPTNWLVYAAPVWSTTSKEFNGAARISYNYYLNNSKWEASLSYLKFTTKTFEPSDGSSKLFLGVQRFVPSFKYTWYPNNLLSKQKVELQVRSFILKEQSLDFQTINTPTDTFDIVSKKANNSTINQLAFTLSNNRVLYPYSANVTIDQGKQFIRAAFTGKYYLNYESGNGGLDIRFFVGKFFYLGTKTLTKQFETDRYQLNLSAPNGQEDYTYSNYFFGRNNFDGIMSQQMMERDGFFKVNTNLYSSKVGKTDDWLVAMNFSASIPHVYNPLSLLPGKIPLKVFCDIGTYSQLWNENSATGRFLFDAGLQISLFNNVANVYMPIFSSKVYRTYNQSVINKNIFLKTIAFNINLQQLHPSKFIKEYPL